MNKLRNWAYLSYENKISHIFVLFVLNLYITGKAIRLTEYMLDSTPIATLIVKENQNIFTSVFAILYVIWFIAIRPRRFVKVFEWNWFVQKPSRLLLRGLDKLPNLKLKLKLKKAFGLRNKKDDWANTRNHQFSVKPDSNQINDKSK